MTNSGEYSIIYQNQVAVSQAAGQEPEQDTKYCIIGQNNCNDVSCPCWAVLQEAAHCRVYGALHNCMLGPYLTVKRV